MHGADKVGESAVGYRGLCCEAVEPDGLESYAEKMDRRLKESVQASGMQSLFTQMEIDARNCAISIVEPEHPKMEVSLFGGLKVRVGGEPIPDGAWVKNKSKLLFAHLVTRSGREVSRDMLLESLWPGMEHRRALNNLYVVWSAMRRALGNRDGECPYVVARGELYRVDSSKVWSDVQEFDELTKRMLFEDHAQEEVERLYMRIDQLYSGEFMAGIKCDAYLLRMRERYRDTYVDALLMASRKILDDGNAPGALWFARKAFEMEAGREDVYQTLMMAQMEAGQRTSAMETFFICKRYLDQELGIPLSKKTLKLYQRLLDGD